MMMELHVVKNYKLPVFGAFSTLSSRFVVGDVPLEVLTQIVETISDPSAMLGPEVRM